MFRQLSAESNVQLARLHELRERELPTLNTRLAAAGLPAIEARK